MPTADIYLPAERTWATHYHHPSLLVVLGDRIGRGLVVSMLAKVHVCNTAHRRLLLFLHTLLILVLVLEYSNIMPLYISTPLLFEGNYYRFYSLHLFNISTFSVLVLKWFQIFRLDMYRYFDIFDNTSPKNQKWEKRNKSRHFIPADCLMSEKSKHNPLTETDVSFLYLRNSNPWHMYTHHRDEKDGILAQGKTQGRYNKQKKRQAGGI